MLVSSGCRVCVFVVLTCGGLAATQSGHARRKSRTTQCLGFVLFFFAFLITSTIFCMCPVLSFAPCHSLPPSLRMGYLLDCYVSVVHFSRVRPSTVPYALVLCFIGCLCFERVSPLSSRLSPISNRTTSGTGGPFLVHFYTQEWMKKVSDGEQGT